jgi:hypothetical protein
VKNYLFYESLVCLDEKLGKLWVVKNIEGFFRETLFHWRSWDYNIGIPVTITYSFFTGFLFSWVFGVSES